LKTINEHIDNLRGVVMMAYPGYYGLPEWDPARILLEINDEFFASEKQEQADLLTPKDATLWWAGKELVRGKLLSDYVGKNEKTKIVIKLQNK